MINIQCYIEGLGIRGIFQCTLKHGIAVWNFQPGYSDLFAVDNHLSRYSNHGFGRGFIFSCFMCTIARNVVMVMVKP